MHGLRKSVFQKKGKAKKVAFDKFSLYEEDENTLRAKDSVNCDCREGVLRRGVGIQPYLDPFGNHATASVSRDLKNAFPLIINDGADNKTNNKLIIITTEGEYCRLDLETGTVFQTKYSEGVVVHCEMRAKGKQYNMFMLYNHVTMSSDGLNYITGMMGDCKYACVAGGRYFIAMAEGKLCFSAANEPSKLKGGTSNDNGTLYMPLKDGEIQQLVEDGGYLYVFLEKAIYRVTVSAQIDKFFVEKVAYEGGKICRYSAAGTGNGIIFLSCSGIYRLRDKKAEKICTEVKLTPCMDEPCILGFCENIILIDYFSTPDGGGTKELKRLAIYKDGKHVYFSEPYGNLSRNSVVCIGKKLYTLSPNNALTEYETLPRFETVPLDLGSNALKRLKRIRLKGSGAVRLEVGFGDVRHEYALSFQNGWAETKLFERAKAFRLAFMPTAADSSVERVEIEYYDE